MNKFELKWIHSKFGKRNAIERYFRILKERYSYNNINSKNREILAINVMVQILAYGYNHLRFHQSLRAPPLGW